MSDRKEKIERIITIFTFILALLSFIFSTYLFLNEHIDKNELLLFPYKTYFNENTLESSLVFSNSGNRSLIILDAWFSYGDLDDFNLYHNSKNEDLFPISLKPNASEYLISIQDNIPTLAKLSHNSSPISKNEAKKIKSEFTEYTKTIDDSDSKLFRKILLKDNTYIDFYINLIVIKEDGEQIHIKEKFDQFIFVSDIDEAHMGMNESFFRYQKFPRQSHRIIIDLK